MEQTNQWMRLLRRGALLVAVPLVTQMGFLDLGATAATSQSQRCPAFSAVSRFGDPRSSLDV